MNLRESIARALQEKDRVALSGLLQIPSTKTFDELSLATIEVYLNKADEIIKRADS